MSSIIQQAFGEQNLKFSVANSRPWIGPTLTAMRFDL